MPELPEVETIRRQLAQKIIGKKISKRPIVAVRRRAKVLIIDFQDGSSLLFHLKLTGQLILNGQPSPTTRKVFYFDDGTKLVFNDARKFGWWKKVKDASKIESEFGPEALTINYQALDNIFYKHPQAKIKPLLMNQKVISGIGNIYSDEILFEARVHPLRQAKSLSVGEIKLIQQNIKKILQKAIKLRGTTEQFYRDACGKIGNYQNYLQVYRKEGKKCPRCGTIIKRIKIGGRSAHFCSNCQKL